MAKRDNETLALALLSAGESAHALSAFLPSAFTIRNWVLCSENQSELGQNIANLRSGYIPAGIFGIGLGSVISVIAKSPLPLVFSAVTFFGMVMLYERALPPELRMRSPLDILALPTAPSAPTLNMAFNPATGNYAMPVNGY